MHMIHMILKLTVIFSLYLSGVTFITTAPFASETEPLIIGLDADMSSGSARSGEAIRRGALLAIDEINHSGGLLGKKVILKTRDHRGNPARGIDNIEAFAKTANLLAVIGGLHTPVAMRELKTIHQNKIIYLGPWAAGTPVIKNGYTPNYAFRVSVRDEYAGSFLIQKAFGLGYKHPGLLLEQTGWGRSNHRAMTAALAQHNTKPASVQWFHWGDKNLKDAITALRTAGSDVIMLVANAPEGAAVINSMAAFPEEQRLPIISHWGITGGTFYETVQKVLPLVNLRFLQTYSFIAPTFPNRARPLIKAYCIRFPEERCRSARDIFAPVGTAHAYDLVHLLALAVRQAGTIDRTAIRTALKQIKFHEGLVRNYQLPFIENHDALTAEDFSLAHYDHTGVIITDTTPPGS